MKLKKSTKLILGTTIGLAAMIACIATPAVCCTKTQINTTTNETTANAITNGNSANSSLTANDKQQNVPSQNLTVASNQQTVNHVAASLASQAPNPIPFQTTNFSSSLLTSQTSFTFTCQNGNVLNLTVNNEKAFTLTLLGFDGSMKDSVLNIPSVVIHNNNFYVITKISAGAFYGQGLTQVNFNTNLQSIGALAFANNELSSLSFPNNLQSIGDKAFISNQFPHAYAVYLPNNTTWSKNWLTCPFGCKDNMNKLIDGIQWVIQGTAAYSYEPDQFAWIITSYDLTSDVLKNNVQVSDALDTDDWTRFDFNNNGTQASYNHYVSNVNAQIALNSTNNLSNFCIWTKNEWGGVGWVFYFNTTNHTFNLYIPNNDHYLMGTGISSTFDISLWDPYTGAYDVNLQNLSANTTSYSTTSWTYHNGDILRFKVNDSQSGAWAYVASNFNQSMLSSSSSIFNGGILNQYIDQSYAWTDREGLATYFSVKNDGIYPTLATTTLSNVAYNPSNGNLTLTGTSLPNLTFGIYISGNKKATFSTDSEGQINSTINIGSGYNATTSITIQATSSNVMVPSPITTHLQGDNPKLSLLYLNLDNVTSQIMFDGLSNKVYVANILQYWPNFASPYEEFNTSTGSSNSFASSGTLDVKVITATGSSSSYTFNYTSSTANSSLTDFLTNLPYQVNDTYTFSGTNLSFNSVWQNYTVVPYEETKSGSTTTITFKVTNTGYEFSGKTLNNIDQNPTYEESDLGDDGSPANQAAQKEVETSYGNLMITPACNYSIENNNLPNYDMYMTNWEDPNSLMVQVAHQIAEAYPNPINKALAIVKWVNQNMNYNWNWTGSNTDEAYQRTVKQIFQSLSGICGNYARLACTLLNLDGFVARTVGGYAETSNGVPAWADVNDAGQSVYYQTHEWMQVWLPSLQEWITFDPTFGIQQNNFFNPIGEVENLITSRRCNMQVGLISWPWKGTDPTYNQYGSLTYQNYEYDDYFSYFKGCEYDALFNVGRRFDIPAGLYDDVIDYDYINAVIKEVNWAANPKNTVPYNGPYMETNWNGNY